MMNVSEASILHPAFEKWTGTRLHISFAHGVDEFVVEFQRRMLFFQRAIWGLPCKVEVDEFDPAAGFGVPKNGTKYLVKSTPCSSGAGIGMFMSTCKDLREALAHETGPVLDGISHESTVNIIKLLAIRPFGFDVVDFETDVRRYPSVGLEACYTPF